MPDVYMFQAMVRCNFFKKQSAILSDNAIIVRAGLALNALGKIELSAIKRLGISKL